jgi:diguanylate cyclase (GGDEF)-like protein
MARALAENRALLGESRLQATTDPLTGLGNRRKLRRDLADASAEVDPAHPLALVVLDLNGFKTYNDAFGHAAGDAVLAEFGRALATAMRGRGEAYRMGGDEFCVLARCADDDAAVIAALCADALAKRGETFTITAAYGFAVLPSEERDAGQALALADARMYSHKATAARRRPADDAATPLRAVPDERAPAA